MYHLIMKMRFFGSPCRTHSPDLLTTLHDIALRNKNAVEMGISAAIVETMADLYAISQPCKTVGLFDYPVSRCEDRRASRRREVDAFIKNPGAVNWISS